MDKEEAMKILKDFHDKSALFSVRTALDTIIPELRESEDEKIRKAILELVRQSSEVLGKQNQNNMITWLEKQGEEKPADKAEPKFKVKYAGNEYNVFEIRDINGVTYYGIEDEPNHIDYVKAENCEIISGYAIKENGSPYPTKPAVFSEQKPKRMISAEAKEALYDKPTDEEMKELLRTEYEKGRADTIAEMEKDWSEEDEKILNNLIDYIKVDDALQYSEKQVVNWLKSLKDRYTWKPSEGQLECLGYAIDKAEKDYSPLANNRIYLTLKALKEELEKLK